VRQRQKRKDEKRCKKRSLNASERVLAGRKRPLIWSTRLLPQTGEEGSSIERGTARSDEKTNKFNAEHERAHEDLC